MLQTTTPTHYIVRSSVALSAGQRVPQGARVLGIYATTICPFSNDRQRVRVLDIRAGGRFVDVVALFPNAIPYTVYRFQLSAICAQIEMVCK